MTPDEARAEAIHLDDARDTAEALRHLARARNTEAEVLYLGVLNLKELPELRDLPALRVLALGKHRPFRVQGELELHWGWDTTRWQTQQLIDVSPVATLTSLIVLDLGACEEVSDLSPLALLTSLNTLNLSGCSKVSDVSPLMALTNLTSLDLCYCHSLSDVSSLVGLTNLTTLNLDGCTGIKSLRPLRSLLPQLIELSLDHCNLRDLPVSVSDSSSRGNVADQVRAYYDDLDAGAATDAEVKLFVLGNGRVGKTQLANRLRQEPFNEHEDSTHGVRQYSFPVEGDDGAEVRVNLWDFGGQDIYHGSHALFLDRHAVFVLLWHPDFEQGTTAEGGVTMTNHPLSYWLDYIRAAAGDDAVVLLAQARADTKRDEYRLPDVEFGNLKVRQIAFSAKTGRGFGTLREQIQEAVRDLLADRPAHQIGIGRAKVRDRLRAWIADDQQRPAAERTHRTISTGQFADLCAEVGGVSSADALLTFLHRTGVVFHNPDLFGGQVVLDQQWALDAIYTVLNRASTLPALRESGRFTRADLAALTWQDYSVPEQELFLGMMRQCDICFEVGRRDRETVYLAPELLPTDRATIDRVLHGRKPGGDADLTATARFRFLHDGVLRSVLARIGRKFGDLATYWKWGVFLYDGQDDARATLEASRGGPGDGPGGGTITVRVWGQKPDRVAQALVAIVNEAAGRAEPQWTAARTADEANVHPDFIRTGRGDAPPALVPGIAPDDEAVVAISYAHGGDADERSRNRRDFVNGLERAMTGWGYAALRDVHELRDGGLIREFVPTLVQRSDGRPRRVVLVLSSKYLKSIHCMAELHAVYQLSLSNRAAFARYAVPCVLEPDLDLDRPEGRAERARFWRERHQALAGCPGEPDYFEINRWVNVVSEMLAFVANMVTDRGFDALTADGFAAVRRMLDRRY